MTDLSPLEKELLEALELVSKGIRQGRIPDQSLIDPQSRRTERLDVVSLSSIINAAIARAKSPAPEGK